MILGMRNMSSTKSAIASAIRFRVDEMPAPEIYGQFRISIQDVILVNNNGEHFIPPETTVYSSPIGVADGSVKNMFIVDGKSRYCSAMFYEWDLPLYITADFGEPCLNLNAYPKWQWWQASDAGTFYMRNPKSFALEAFIDGEWVVLDEVKDYVISTPANSELGYEGVISL